MIENIGAYSQVDYDRGYQKGRTDGIDECISVIKSMRLDNISSNGHNIIDALDQLKEQTNE